MPSRSGWASRSSRTSCSGLPSPWRTVTTKRGPTKIITSPISTGSALSTWRAVLMHEEQRVAEHLELRPLVGVHGVLDRQRVQLEALAHRLDDLGAGVVEADPDEAVAARVGAAERGLELDAAALPVALVVEPAVDDGGADVLDALGRARRPARARGRAESRRGSGNQERPSGGMRQAYPDARTGVFTRS